MEELDVVLTIFIVFLCPLDIHFHHTRVEYRLLRSLLSQLKYTDKMYKIKFVESCFILYSACVVANLNSANELGTNIKGLCILVQHLIIRYSKGPFKRIKHVGRTHVVYQILLDAHV